MVRRRGSIPAVIVVLNAGAAAAAGIAAAFSQPHPLDGLAASSATATSSGVPPVPIPPWYSDPGLSRDRGHVIPADGGFDYRPSIEDDGSGDGGVGLSPKMMDVMRRPTSRIIPFRGIEAYVRRLEGVKQVEPLLLRYENCDPRWFGDDSNTISWLGRLRSVDDEGDVREEDAAGEQEEADYFAVDISHSSSDGSAAFVALAAEGVESSPVRNFGDAMPSRTHAALLASANGLLSFHRAHRFCSRCGSPTAQTKAGSARRCTDSSCGTSVYPRIDPAVIMLITSPCGEHALLGRNRRWPAGRYSTLAGFAEVGETLEECVARETREETGVEVDPASIRFVASQPWPFPRSVMVGFTGRALADACPGGEGATIGDDDGDAGLPTIFIDPAELDDARWFGREYVQANGLVEGRGSSALDFEPDEEEAEFHVPGPASLARLLITKWVTTGNTGDNGEKGK
mmetsp:Transcript_3278/g.6798  ORF Transcript_3278/g.6798 Transcript_3278/m.6798 type:complete len:457 (-) Transcript_3278:158-1528(-)